MRPTSAPPAERLTRARRAASNLGGVRKAAVFILALEESVASDLLQSLGDHELESLTAEIARLGVVEQEQVSAVLEEFHDLAQLYGVVREGGLEQAIRLVNKSFPGERAGRLKELLEAHREHLPFAFLSKAETRSLLALLEGERPQTVAVVLANMTPSKAADVLEKFDPEKQRDILGRIASLEGTHEEVIRRLEESFRKYLDRSMLENSRGSREGIEAAADILRASGPHGLTLLESLNSERPELAGKVFHRVFSFDDLEHLGERQMNLLLGEVEPRRLAVALKMAPAALKKNVYRYLPASTRATVDDELETLGPLRRSDVDEARQEIVEKALALDEVKNNWMKRGDESHDDLVY